MAQERDNSGILFPNDKGGVEKRPDVRGEACVNGVQYKVSGWQKEGQKGPFISLAFQPVEQQQQQAPAAGGGMGAFFGGPQQAQQHPNGYAAPGEAPPSSDYGAPGPDDPQGEDIPF